MADQEKKPNQGALYPDPLELVATGPMNVNGVDTRLLVSRKEFTDRDGNVKVFREVWVNVGLVWPPKEKGENTPDYSGDVEINDEKMRLAMWHRTPEGRAAYTKAVLTKPREGYGGYGKDSKSKPPPF